MLDYSGTFEDDVRDTSLIDPVGGTAYERLHQSGPEYEGCLSHHGPMTA